MSQIQVIEQVEQYESLDEPAGIYWRPFNEYGFTSPWAPHLWKAAVGTNYAISSLIALAFVAYFSVVSEECRHWFVLPLMLCGILAGSDLVAWLRKEVDALDFKVLVGFGMYLVCFLAPFLHYLFGIQAEDLQTSDNRAYFGYMACFNIAGIIFFKLAQNTSFKMSRPVKVFWQMNPNRFIGVLIPTLCLSITATLVIRFVFGGLAKHGGEAFGGASAEATGHLSWIMMLGDPLAVLFVMTMIFWISQRDTSRQRGLLLAMFLVVLATGFQFLLVGARGSRSALVNAVIIIGAVIHFRLRRFSAALLIAGGISLVLFVYLLGFYKHLGARGWQAFYSGEARKSMSYELGGLGSSPIVLFLSKTKSDVQAYELYRLVEFKGSYQPVLGQTYLMSVLTFIPRGIWKTKPFQVKARAGTALQGIPGSKRSSRVYGLAGEAMLNFSYWGIVPAFFVFGLIVGWIRKKIATMEPLDSRFFLVSILVYTFSLAMIGDSGNSVFGLLKMGTLPFMVIFLGSIRARFVGDYGEIAEMGL